MREEMISVAMATYNGTNYIEEQIKSIISQTRKVSEIVICDDCSKDGTVNMLREILEKTNLPFTIIEHEKKCGVVASFFDAIHNTKGNIVFLADQDDVWKSIKVEKFMECFELDDFCALCFSNADLVNGHLESLGSTLWDEIDYHGQCMTKDEFITELLKRNLFTGMSMAFRKDIILNNLLFSRNMLHDEMIGWTAVLNSRVKGIEMPLALYRQHEKNVKGIKGKTVKDLDNNTKRIISQNNERFYLKFLDVLNYVKEDESKKTEIEDASIFYKWRTDLVNTSITKGIISIIINVINGSYIKYSSKSDHAILKDIYICFFR